MGRRKGVKQTGRVAAQRRERSAQRQAHRVGLAAGTIAADVPEPLVPEQFQAITTTYWQCLKAVPDPRAAWEGAEILERILLHWDTETGVFGVKDHTFDEDGVRYKHVQGAMAHVVLLNTVLNCLWAPALAAFWSPDAPLSQRLQFFRDHPEYCPIRSP